MSTEFVAEVSSNHDQDLGRSLAFIDAAARIGCGAVKFQLFKLRQLFAPEAIAAHPDLLLREAWELPLTHLPHLKARCQRLELRFSVTPFYLKAVDQLFPFVDFYKVASYELMWDDLLKECAGTGKPVVLSCGMATLDETRRAVDVLRTAGCKDLTLLHCISGYPTPPDQCNLAAIETLRDACECPVGWSDHSVDAQVVERAVLRWRASMIEFHLDLDGQGAEYASGHCWLPEQIAPVIEAVAQPHAATAEPIEADGDGNKVPAPAELHDREWRADPSDGLRPLRAVREALSANDASA
jgi:sialic acid synthase SpsE